MSSFGLLLMITSVILAGLMGISDREFYWLLIPFFGSSYGYYLYRKDHMDMMSKSGMSVYSPSSLITMVILQSIVPLIVYSIFYLIF
tara:strand:+ start:60 stop:320 length:261 start_codon:yes stop_codon:yes gene_type:complete